MSRIAQELKTANSLVKALEVFDSAGYADMGIHSQLFLNDIATKGAMSKENLMSYSNDLQNHSYNSLYIQSALRAQVEELIESVKAYSEEPSYDNSLRCQNAL